MTETERKNTRLVIFDFDGTLADTHRTIVATVQQTLQEVGLPVATEEAITATIGLPLRECYRRYIPAIDEAMLDACEEVHHRRFDDNRRAYGPVPFPRVKETLQWLRERKVMMSIASSRTSASLRLLLEDMGIREFFCYVVGAEEVKHPKPNAEPVLKTLEALSVEAGEALVVGDMGVDILMGARAGCSTCGVTYGNGSREELADAGAKHIINSIEELRGVVS